jgi:hypothetical protein
MLQERNEKGENKEQMKEGGKESNMEVRCK